MEEEAGLAGGLGRVCLLYKFGLACRRGRCRPQWWPHTNHSLFIVIFVSFYAVSRQGRWCPSLPQCFAISSDPTPMLPSPRVAPPPSPPDPTPPSQSLPSYSSPSPSRHITTPSISPTYPSLRRLTPPPPPPNIPLRSMADLRYS